MDLDWDQPQDDAELDGEDGEEETAKKLFSERVINEIFREILKTMGDKAIADGDWTPTSEAGADPPGGTEGATKEGDAKAIEEPDAATGGESDNGDSGPQQDSRKVMKL
eukprot:jgi/Tetstr1/454653/TSEL_041543.t1